MKKSMLWVVPMLMVLDLTASSIDIDGVTWYYDRLLGGVQIVSGQYRYFGDLTIPSSIDGYPVTSIGKCAFDGCYGLQSLVIPSGVKSIGDSAFYGCNGLRSVTIASSVTNIGAYAFYGCSSLESISIPSHVTRIGEATFRGCRGLRSVMISSSVTSIGDFAFYNCIKLSSVVIPPSVKNIGESAFCGCGGLTTVTIGAGVECIADMAFYDCQGLVSVTIPSSVTTIGNSAFGRCSSLKSVSIPSGVGRICRGTFFDCSGLTSVTIPLSVTNIEEGAFDGCFELKEVTIPSSVKSVGDMVFDRCYGLVSVTISEGVESIGAGAFFGCRSLSLITIPSTVTNIGELAFGNCSGIAGFLVAENNLSYSSRNGLLCSVDGTTLLRGVRGDVEIPIDVTGVENCAFSGCTGLTSVMIPESVMSIGEYAFGGCSSITNFFVAAENPIFSSRNGLLCSKNGTELIQGLSGDVVIPSCVTQIGDYAFYGCGGLTSVVVPSNVMSIGSQAFYDCSGLRVAYVDKGDVDRVKRLYGWPSEIEFLEVVEASFNIGKHGVRIAGGELVQLVVVGEMADEPVICPKKDWFFAGWNVDPTLPMCSNIVFTAVYEPIIEYSICYLNVKNLVNPNPTVYTVTNEITFVELEDYYGYSFKGWEPARIEVGTTGDLVVTAKWDRVQGVAEAAGDQSREWVSSGDADWFVTWDDEKGKYVVRSGEIGHDQISVLETVVTNGGTVSFDVKISCEGMQRGQRTDGLSILVDGVEELWLDGEVDWRSVTIAVTGEGEHRIKWKYSKDVEGAAGEDCAYLANFKFYHQVVVSFDGGGATVGEVPSDIVSYNGGTITLPEVGTMKKINHSFVGWSDGVEVYQPGAIFVLGDVPPAFTAVWSRKELDSPVIEVPARYETERTRVTITAVEGATIRYTIDGTDPIENGLVYQGPFEVAGSLTIRAVAVRDDWYDSAVVEASTVRAPWGYAECLNCEDVGFTSGGDSAWVRDLLVSHDGTASVRSGKIGNSETNWLEATVIGAGTLSFWWKASAEMWRQQFVDCGTLWIDGVEQLGVKIGNHDDWRQELIAIKGGTRHTIRWVYSKDVEDAVPFEWEDCIWLDEVMWHPVLPSVADDAGTTVTGDAETGYVVRPSEGNTAVEVTIPQGVDAAKVTVEVSPKVASVKPNGAKVKIVSGGADITGYLNVPAADGSGVVDLTKATVKEEYVKEALDPGKGAEIKLNAANPSLTTPNTRKGLFYQLREGETLDGMVDGDSKVGDGQPWTPEIKVKGGNSAFYAIGVGKGE